MKTFDDPAHIVYQEVACPDGYITTKVPLRHIQFLDIADLKRRICGQDQERFARYSELIYNGHYANGVPIVYRTPKGNLIASDLRHSDIAIYAGQNVKPHAAVPRNFVHPMIDVKIIEVSSRADIIVQRAVYLDKTSWPHAVKEKAKEKPVKLLPGHVLVSNSFGGIEATLAEPPIIKESKS